MRKTANAIPMKEVIISFLDVRNHVFISLLKSRLHMGGSEHDNL